MEFKSTSLGSRAVTSFSGTSRRVSFSQARFKSVSYTHLCCYAGDIAAAVGLKNTSTGDTLCDEKPVSYTHLDVYKRQSGNRANAGYGSGFLLPDPG